MGTLFRLVLDRFLLLPLGVLIALAWANLEPESYFRVAQSYAFPVNEIGMAVFLALIAQELYESLMPGGVLAAWRDRTLPSVAALGGLAGSVVSYLLLVRLWHEQMLASAWPVVATIDLAAGYYLLRVIYPRRGSVVSILLLTAVLTDTIAIAIVWLQTPSITLHPGGFALFAAALASAAMLSLKGARSFWPYWLISGTLSWLALWLLGVHPALALVPIVPLLPHDRRKSDVFADRVDGDPVHHSEHEWHGAAQVALFLFGLVNGGVMLRHADTGTWAVLAASVVGRPIGMIAALVLAVAAGLRLPARTSWRDMLVMAMATSSGFTFALLLGVTMLPIGAVAEQVTLGALLTIAGAPLALTAAWLMGVGRFRRRAVRAAGGEGPVWRRTA